MNINSSLYNKGIQNAYSIPSPPVFSVERRPYFISRPWMLGPSVTEASSYLITT